MKRTVRTMKITPRLIYKLRVDVAQTNPGVLISYSDGNRSLGVNNWLKHHDRLLAVMDRAYTAIMDNEPDDARAILEAELTKWEAGL